MSACACRLRIGIERFTPNRVIWVMALEVWGQAWDTPLVAIPVGATAPVAGFAIGSQGRT